MFSACSRSMCVDAKTLKLLNQHSNIRDTMGKKRKYRCVTSKRHRKKWWNGMTKRERQQLRDAKGQKRKIDRVAEKYAEIALGIARKSDESTKKQFGYKVNNHNKRKIKPFKTRETKTMAWERKWCQFCKHPNPKNLVFCQLCDSNLPNFKEEIETNNTNEKNTNKNNSNQAESKSNELNETVDDEFVNFDDFEGDSDKILQLMNFEDDIGEEKRKLNRKIQENNDLEESSNESENEASDNSDEQLNENETNVKFRVL